MSLSEFESAAAVVNYQTSTASALFELDSRGLRAERTSDRTSAAFPVRLAQNSFEDLSGRRLGQVVMDLDQPRDFEALQCGRDVTTDRVDGHLCSVLGADGRGQDLTIFLIGNSEHCHVGYFRHVAMTASISAG